MLKRNKDGSISVGILDDFAKDVNPPVIEDAPEAKEPKAEEKPAKKPVRKSVKK